MFPQNEYEILKIIGRKFNLFEEDLQLYPLDEKIRDSKFLVLGGAGSIGSAVVKEIFKRNPQVLHVVDLSENNLAELVRDIRSSLGYIEGDFKTFAIDIGTDIYDKFFNDSVIYDYILNFSALKHVRSEKDPYTLMRMIEVNILNTIKTLEQSIKKGVKKYFCVSTDKATNPVNMMGASKRIMELFLVDYSNKIDISTARFANVAFSDGSLLHSFIMRIQKLQPIVIPKNVKRYFITQRESAILCLLSCLYGNNLEIFFPKLNSEQHMKDFWEIAKNLLNYLGYEPYLTEKEQEARNLSTTLPKEGRWACYLSDTDTTGEKEYEEFYSDTDQIDWNRFKDIGVIKMKLNFRREKLTHFVSEIKRMREKGSWNKANLIALFIEILPEFRHLERQKYLDEKM
ncbi:MAG: UDP-N-acetylglucosamine 4,6-dehydratase [Thermodesulfovibrio sp.]|nr:UDP-N-acetylglucosamine 4,6-dehydratase [Thermodesulfovibrio sp.]MDW7998302.1 UDP-N-acetylglucosamine 4,6-dehydratase [Thermodesulfovibrio sp.]